MSAIYTMKGVLDLLEVFEDRVTIIHKRVLGFLSNGVKGTNEIPFQSIVAIQFKEAGAVFGGHIKFTIPGGNGTTGGIFGTEKADNTFVFAEKKNNALAIEIKTYIDSKVRKLRSRKPCSLDGRG